MTALRGCPFCSGWMRWNQHACNECSGKNSRESYRERTAALAQCIAVAAVEEMRFRYTFARMLDEPLEAGR